jgi:hypothetical protein
VVGRKPGTRAGCCELAGRASGRRTCSDGADCQLPRGRGGWTRLVRAHWRKEYLDSMPQLRAMKAEARRQQEIYSGKTAPSASGRTLA